jgi:hypothetical protein
VAEPPFPLPHHVVFELGAVVKHQLGEPCQVVAAQGGVLFPHMVLCDHVWPVALR